MVKVEIITIGDELLIGQVVDTNSSWMSQQLNKVGFDVQYKTTVGDVESDILDAFERAFSRVSVVLVTGGIGPTKDDITKHTLCRFFNARLVFDLQTLKTVENVMAGLHRDLNELTRNQAYVPDNCTVIQNKAGTAPVTWFERNGKILVSMPGVPYEMKAAMSNDIIPRLQAFFPVSAAILHRTFWVKNYSESLLSMQLETFECALPDFIKLAYLPTSGLIRLRLTGKSDNEESLAGEMQKQRDKLWNLLQNDIVSEADEDLEITLDKLLREKGLTLSVAESCTGGKLAGLFTAIPGCSRYFKGGVVSYSNEAKRDVLGVNFSDIEEHGAVSRPVVEQMAWGARKIFHSDCSIATTGIAGPDGGTPGKPVGTVWIAVSYNDKLHAQKFHFSQNRESNILRACNTGMQLLLEIIFSHQ
ncbi:MAG: CinA family nicotinamide mononucleotide deamidase-related protein [Dysgonamonadaceae bacterium]|jgi:nicotinamide-nucleotide amidase|nr:CinA family nicotinamide mononucleotide deamidase-related protein [Dysgonamonadaceae bacterium]